MITKEQGTKIKEILGRKFMDKIRAALQENNVRTQKKKELSVPMISLMLAEKREHEKAEKVIWDLVDYTVQEKEQEQRRQTKIFERFDSLENG